MGPQFQKVALLSLALILGIQAADIASTGPVCEDGWKFHNDRCYLMRNEYETFDMAQQTCNLFGAELAFADSPDTLVFLSKLVSKDNTYGFWYGAKVSYDNKSLIYNDRMGFFMGPPPGLDVLIPERKKLSPLSTGCVGLIHDHISNPVDYYMIDVPCRITLPYVCRGDPRKVKLPKDDHVIQNSTNDVYWFSNSDDRRSYDDAKKACSDKSMTLLSVRGDLQMNVVINELNRRQDNRTDPWWIGLQVKNGVFSWSSTVYMDSSIVEWNRKGQRRTYYTDYYCRILLSDGTVDDKNCRSAKAPFICKRRHAMVGRFGCPKQWWRAGQSCYIRASPYKNGYVSYSDAEKLCSKTGSHPISLDTPLEKMWFMKSLFYGNGNYYGIWTSLNDRKNPGNFVWADGSSPKKSIVKYSSGQSLKQGGKCFLFTPNTKVLSKTVCENNALPGCQHLAKGPSDCVTKNWTYFQENCYYFSQPPTNTPHPTMLHTCYQDIVKKNSQIVVSPLKIDSKDVMDFYSKYIADWNYVWVGLQKKAKGVYTWSDGTTADISIFQTKYSYGSDKSTSKCVTMASNGDFEKMSCTDCNCGTVVCEKELSYHSGNNNGNNIVMSHLLSEILMMFWTVISLYRFL